MINYNTLIRKVAMPVAFALGVGLATPTYAQEWHIGDAPATQTQAVKSEPLDPKVDQFIDYVSFLAESILEVRGMKNDYESQKGIRELRGIEKSLAQVKDLRKSLKELSLSFPKAKSDDPLDQFLDDYITRREQAEEEREEQALANPFRELGMNKPKTLGCSEHREYQERLSQIADSYLRTQSAALRQNPEIRENNMVQRFEGDLSSLLRVVEAKGTRFGLQNNCGGDLQ